MRGPSNGSGREAGSKIFLEIPDSEILCSTDRSLCVENGRVNHEEGISIEQCNDSVPLY